MCQSRIGEADNMAVNIAVLPGDGVVAAVTTEVLNVLQAVGEKLGHRFKFNEGLGGGVAINTLGKALSYETLHTIVECARPRFERRIVWNST
jgi:isocitrate/isopropylmalate dehydrogenase